MSKSNGFSRRDFLKSCLVAGGGTVAAPGVKLWAFDVAEEFANPLAAYPERDWEKIYRDQYRYDDSFSWVCSPNDTHACRCMAYTRNGVVTRLGSQYDYETYADLYGNKATPNWNPRQCAKGYTFHRVVYGPYRLKYPIVRQGWKQWADDGYPSLTDELRTKYKFDARGQDTFVKIAWEDTFRYIAKGYQSIAKTYSGAEGAKRLLGQGYPKEMVDEMGEAGTRTFKFRGGMGLLGVIGKYGIYRLNNSMALLDAQIRGVDPSVSTTMSASVMEMENFEFEWTVLYDEWIYVLDGVLTIELEDGTHDLNPGDSLWLPDGTWHFYHVKKARAVVTVYPLNWRKIKGVDV